MPFLPPNQQRQSTEGIKTQYTEHVNYMWVTGVGTKASGFPGLGDLFKAKVMLFLSLLYSVLKIQRALKVLKTDEVLEL